MADGPRPPAPSADPPSRWSLGLVRAQGVQSDLAEIVPHAAQGHLHRAASTLTGLLLRRELRTPDWAALPSGLATAGWSASQSLEFSVEQFQGVSHNRALSLVWRPALGTGGPGRAGWQLAWGLGWWHSAGRPWYHHAGHPEVERRWHNLLAMTPEVAWRPAAAPAWSLALRVHHVSGAYGLVAPAQVGTNHMAVVLMRDL